MCVIPSEVEESPVAVLKVISLDPSTSLRMTRATRQRSIVVILSEAKNLWPNSFSVREIKIRDVSLRSTSQTLHVSTF
ncbi:MAG: hypothetical protein DMF24_08780 [Verrucomicrobia bacterium]|nr:MAG: hypothetical protein DMF24_08780 [Verrucomicrobiota bacterium]